MPHGGKCVLDVRNSTVTSDTLLYRGPHSCAKERDTRSVKSRESIPLGSMIALNNFPCILYLRSLNVLINVKAILDYISPADN